MPVTVSAKKALRRDRRRTQVNRRIKVNLKSALDSYRQKPSASALKQVYRALDIAVKKNLLHRNKAARLKSAFAQISVSSTVSKSAKPKRKSSAPAKKNKALKAKKPSR